jgi:hypothetical protein
MAQQNCKSPLFSVERSYMLCFNMRTGVGKGLLRRLATIPLLVVCATLLLGVSGAGATGGRPVKNGRYKGVVGPGWAISFRVSADGT